MTQAPTPIDRNTPFTRDLLRSLTATIRAQPDETDAEYARGGIRFRGDPVNCRRMPETAGRWAAFWHLVQEGHIEDDRLPDLRRCERLSWVRWTIESAQTHPEIDMWENTRGTEVNVLLWYREEYLVVLARRQGYWLLRTAYCTDQSRRAAQLRRECDAFQRTIARK